LCKPLTRLARSWTGSESLDIGCERPMRLAR